MVSTGAEDQQADARPTRASYVCEGRIAACWLVSRQAANRLIKTDVAHPQLLAAEPFNPAPAYDIGRQLESLDGFKPSAWFNNLIFKPKTPLQIGTDLKL